MLAYCQIKSVGTYYSKILFKIQNYPFNEMHLYVLSVKCWPFCPRLNVLSCWPWCDVQSSDLDVRGVMTSSPAHLFVKHLHLYITIHMILMSFIYFFLYRWKWEQQRIWLLYKMKKINKKCKWEADLSKVVSCVAKYKYVKLFTAAIM